MSLSSIGMSELLIILLIVMLLFGTKRLKTLGGDLGEAIRGFRRAMEGQESNEPAAKPMIRGDESTPAVAAETSNRPAPDSNRR
jgi:sec-independent protein translocase protein TatA